MWSSNSRVLRACIHGASPVLVGIIGALACSDPQVIEAVGSSRSALTRPPGCSPTGNCSVSMQIPDGTSLGHFGALALDSVRLAPRARIRQLDGTPAAAAAIGVGGVAVGGFASTGALISGRDITVDGGAAVAGYVWAVNRLYQQAGATILGDVIQGQAFTTTPITLVPTVALPTTWQAAVNLEPNQSRSIGPGAYSSWSVKTGASLRLARGTYFVGSFGLEPGGSLHLSNNSGSVELHVFEWLNCKGSWRPDSVTSNVRIVYWGTNSTVLECDLPRTPVVAPNAAVRLADRKLAGQIAARDVELGVEASVETATFHSFTSGPGGIRLSDLTLAQRQASCAAVAALEGETGKRTRCRLWAHGRVRQQGPTDDAESQQLCSQEFDACMAETPCADPAPFPSACSITLGERDACLESWLPRVAAAFANIPACEEFRVFDVYTYRAAARAPVPPECIPWFQWLSSGG